MFQWANVELTSLRQALGEGVFLTALAQAKSMSSHCTGSGAAEVALLVCSHRELSCRASRCALSAPLLN